MLPQYHFATQSPQFDVSFPENLLKIVAIRGYSFALNSPNSAWRPVGKLKRSSDPLAAIRGPTSKGREKEGISAD